MMASGRVTSEQGYLGVVQTLAKQALGVARDLSPHRAPQGERRWAMAGALPAARVLLGDTDASTQDELAAAVDELGLTLAQPTGKVTDGFGHNRPVYAWLALHLLGTAARLSDAADAQAAMNQAVTHAMNRSLGADAYDGRLMAWRDLVAWEHGLTSSAESEGLNTGDDPAPLAALGIEDLIDAWTYRELVGLHSLHLTALLTGDRTVSARVACAALYHLGHTQPDYTTYQPWGLAAFASDAQTAVFAEQQLHDVATHLSIEGPGGAVLPALLLADAAATMSGRAMQAWHDR